jgi:ATP-dependent Clp endopeptidase proteolytic subunit ClpP
MGQVRALIAGQTQFRAATAGSTGSAEIVIYDQIGTYGVTAAMFRDALQKVASAKSLTVRINSPGGDVFDGLAIHNMLARHPVPVTVTIDGLAASIASMIAMAGRTVVMPENAMLMIHNPHGGVLGEASDMKDFAFVLEKIRDQMVNTYAAKTGQSTEALVAMMNKTTWMTAAEALALRFCDEVIGPAKVAARFDISHFATEPKATSGWDMAFDRVEALRPRPFDVAQGR